jgi:hypothetical protein
MVSKKGWIGVMAALLALSLLLVNGCGEKKSEEKAAGDATKTESKATAAVGDQGLGLPLYPGATQDPEYPPVNAPHIKNLHILTSDPFETVVEWYSQKLGPFDIDKQQKGSQAMWNKETQDGFFMTATITTILAPPGKVAIVLNKMKTEK